MNKEEILIKPEKSKSIIPISILNFLLKPFYLLLKKDMIRKLSKKHGEQFIDDVMNTFDMPTNFMEKYYKK